MALTRRVLPADYLMAGYNGIMGLVWLGHLDAGVYAVAIFLAHLIGVSLPWLLAHAPRVTSRPLRVFLDLYPLLFLMVFWPELDLIREVLGPWYFDEPIMALDRWLFGLHLHTTWMPAMPYVVLSELMFLMYVLYYPLIFLPPLIMAVRGRRDALQDMTFRLMVTYTGCYLIYTAMPVLGPHYLLEPFQGVHTNGFFYQLSHSITAEGSSRGTAFPSSHVAGAVTIAFLGWRWFPRWIATLLTVEALGVVLATVYTQNHYGIDSLAGIVWALGLQVMVVPMLLKGFGAPRAATPVLPDFARLVPVVERRGEGGP